ncbi:hypothetical protein BH10PSE18_BH10PSE18_13260 [soil metagenome]
MNEFKTALDVAVSSCPASLPISRAYKCEFTLNIGLFFDGTDNNWNVEGDLSSANTNVTRLSAAYRNNPSEGFYRHYVSGVGTPFTEIGEKIPPALGGPFGAGGEARIVYGLLQVVNSLHGFVNNQKPRFSEPQLAALCSETQVPDLTPGAPHPPSLTPQQNILKDLGLSRGLVGASDRSFLGANLEGERHRFFARIASELTQQVRARATLPKISAIYLDVFGFSRGAAQARVFTSWLHDLMLGRGELFGVPSYVRMLGLFDTVSSVGVTNAAGGSGHNAWGLAKDLRIHPEVKRCVHFVALHELRANFPSDSVGGEEGVVPPNCSEHFYPGAHSDVGGGYAAGEQGKAGMAQSVEPRRSLAKRFEPEEGRKLSQFSLNQMYDAARAACENHEYVPWMDLDSAAGRAANLHLRYAMSHDVYGTYYVRRAVERYFAEFCGVPAGLNARDALRQHGLRYLAWRYRVTVSKSFEDLGSVKSAAIGADRESLDYYRLGQRIFEDQVRLLSKAAPVIDLNLTGDKEVRQGFHPKSQEIFKEMKALALHDSLGNFFDAWVHDSYAGFIGKFKAAAGGNATLRNLIHVMAEPQRYVRWRGLYCGSDVQVNARLPQVLDADARRSA